jgi:hypothetical protein
MNAIANNGYSAIYNLENAFSGKLMVEDSTPDEVKNLLTTIAVATKDGFVDDHSGKKVEGHPSYLVLAKDEVLYLCPTYGDGGFCLSPIEMVDGVAHLSRYSVGGVVYTARPTLEGNLRDYNNGRGNHLSDNILACAQKRSVGYAVKAV